MDASQLAREMLRKGVLISPEAAAELEKNPDLVSSVRVPERGVVRAVLRQRTSVMWSAQQKTNVSVASVAESYNKRFSFYRSVLEPKADRRLLVSIAKASPNTRISIIGMVRDVTNNNAVLEDSTGKILVVTNDALIEDECVLVTGVAQNDRLIAESVVYPDIPMGRDVRTSLENIDCFFTQTIPMRKKDVVVITDPTINAVEVERLSGDVVWPDGRSEKILCPRTPCLLDINGVRVLVYRLPIERLRRIADTPEKAVVRLLKARHLDPSFGVVDDCLLLREVPDVVCLITNTLFTVNYKGVTAVSPSEKTSYKIDLKTRVVEAVENTSG